MSDWADVLLRPIGALSRRTVVPYCTAATGLRDSCVVAVVSWRTQLACLHCSTTKGTWRAAQNTHISSERHQKYLEMLNEWIWIYKALRKPANHSGHWHNETIITGNNVKSVQNTHLFPHQLLIHKHTKGATAHFNRILVVCHETRIQLHD